ncbi:MAG: hypothetical protein QF574_04615 [Arenicellales bacterium]|nr:hypothetical protein [Arenicellales bacterium]
MDRHLSGGRSFRPLVLRDLKRIRDELSHCALPAGVRASGSRPDRG